MFDLDSNEKIVAPTVELNERTTFYKFKLKINWSVLRIETFLVFFLLKALSIWPMRKSLVKNANQETTIRTNDSIQHWKKNCINEAKWEKTE